jgi:dTDP-4-dehydrorhamnose reductase
MKILVTGANGQLGREIAVQAQQHTLIMTDLKELDITDHQATADFFRQVKPGAVIHCAAYTNVDKAETDADTAFRINVAGTQNIAAGCLATGARMVYISTDYVFDGQSQQAYREFDAVNPQSAYGRTKWQGEQMVRHILGRHYILRTAWLYGDGNNFVRTMLKLAGEGNPLRVVDDQVGTPTSTTELTKAILRLLDSDAYGTYHATCQGQCSWYEFACEIFRQAGKKVDICPVTTAEFPRPAKRPPHSVLDNYMLRMTVGDPMASWQDALRSYLEKE